ncbi:uncharacterized protein LOC135462894 [Liolophura sinensis]|uniref:uncharacterized protein LOC135462894 n=1 Tax=Liolophura sinensis TaxID=3198878 RepID=UPI0031591C3C
MGMINDFSSASRWGKLLVLVLILGTTVLGTGMFTLNWAKGSVVQARDWNKNVIYSRNLSDIFEISSQTGLWEFCTSLTFKEKYRRSPSYYYKEILQKSVSGCRRINVEKDWLRAVQVIMALAFPTAIVSVLLIGLYIFSPQKYRVDKTSIATGIASFLSCVLIGVGVAVFGIHLNTEGLALSQFDCYYLDFFNFAAIDLSWSYLITCFSAFIFLTGSCLSYFLTLRTRQRERMRRRSESRKSASRNTPQLLQQSSQVSDNVFA